MQEQQQQLASPQQRHGSVHWSDVRANGHGEAFEAAIVNEPAPSSARLNGNGGSLSRKDKGKGREVVDYFVEASASGSATEDTDVDLAEDEGDAARNSWSRASGRMDRRRLSWDLSKKGKSASPERVYALGDAQQDEAHDNPGPNFSAATLSPRIPSSSGRPRHDSHSTVLAAPPALPLRMSWQSSSGVPRSASPTVSLTRRQASASAGNHASSPHERDGTATPDSLSGKRRKRRSNTWDAVALSQSRSGSASRLHTLSRGASRNHSRDGSPERHRRINGGYVAGAASSSEDDDDEDASGRVDLDAGYGQPMDKSSSSGSHGRRLSPSPPLYRHHLPRSASEMMTTATGSSASTPSRGSMRGGFDEKQQKRHSHQIRSPSPTIAFQQFGRSKSSGNMPLSNLPSVSRTGSSGQVALSRQRDEITPLKQAPPLRKQTSSLQMRARKGSASREASSASTSQYATVSSPSTPAMMPLRKRAKSSLAADLVGQVQKPHLTMQQQPPGTAPAGRSFSASVVPPRRRRGSSEARVVFPALDTSLRPVLEPEHASRSPKRVVTGGRESPERQRAFPRVSPQLSPQRFVSASPDEQDPPPIPASRSRPFSIAGLMQQQEVQARQEQQESAMSSGPSLQDLLKQVDVRGALALVKEVQAHGSGVTSSASQHRLSTAFPAQASVNMGGRGAESGMKRPASQDFADARSRMSSYPSTSSIQDSSLSGATAPLLPAFGYKTSSERRGSVHVSSEALPSHPSSPDLGRQAVDKKKRRMSIAALLGPSTAKKDRQKERVVGTAASGPSQMVEAEDDPNVILQKISPAVTKYVSQVKAELEIRYLPVYTALAMGQAPPNPAEVARWRYRKEDIVQRRRALEEQGKGQGHANMRTSLDKSNTSTSLIQRLRIKGHRHAIWEVYPRDYVEFGNARGAILDDLAEMQEADERRDVLREAIRPGQRLSQRHFYHRHASSDISLRSLGSIQEDGGSYGHHHHPSDISSQNSKGSPAPARRRSLHHPYQSPLSSGRNASLGTSSFSPSHSHHSQPSNRSTSLTHEEALGLASSPKSLPSSTNRTAGDLLGPGLSLTVSTHERYLKALQSSPEHGLYGKGHFEGQSPISPTLGSPAQKGHRRKFVDRFKLNRHDEEPVVEASGDSIGSRQAAPTSQSRDYASGEIVRADAYSDRESSVPPSLVGALPDSSRPALSRHSSKSSSIANLSRIIGSRRRPGGNETDGYRSTDNEDGPGTSVEALVARMSNAGGVRSRAKWRGATIPPVAAAKDRRAGRLTSGDESGFDEGQPEATDAKRMPIEEEEHEDVFSQKSPTDFEVVDVQDDEYEKAEQSVCCLCPSNA